MFLRKKVTNAYVSSWYICFLSVKRASFARYVYEGENVEPVKRVSFVTHVYEGGKRGYQLLSWTHLSMNTTLDFTPHAREWMFYMYGVICESFSPLERIIRVLYECFGRNTWVTFCNMRQPLGSHACEWGSDRISAFFLSTPVCVIERWCIIPA